MDELKEMIEFHDNQESKGVVVLVKDKTNRKALLIVLGLIAADNMCGVNVVWFYMAEIFKVITIFNNYSIYFN